MRGAVAAVLALALAGALRVDCGAEGRAADPIKVDLAPRLGAQLPLDARFRDERGASARLGDYFGGGKPVILALVYYECPMLCTLTLNGLLRGLGALPWSAGKDFQVIAVSIAPAETPRLAAEKKRRLLESYPRPGADRGWHLLTGGQDEIARVARAAGFRYVEDRRTGQYAHAAGVLIVTPEGRIAQALYGVEYAPRDLRLALLGASSGRLGSPVERALLYCYRYDPAIGRYSLAILRLARAAAAVTVLALAGLIWTLRRAEAA